MNRSLRVVLVVVGVGLSVGFGILGWRLTEGVRKQKIGATVIRRPGLRQTPPTMTAGIAKGTRAQVRRLNLASLATVTASSVGGGQPDKRRRRRRHPRRTPVGVGGRDCRRVDSIGVGRASAGIRDRVARPSRSDGKHPRRNPAVRRWQCDFSAAAASRWECVANYVSATGDSPLAVSHRQCGGA